jgi:hypothetical protein
LTFLIPFASNGLNSASCGISSLCTFLHPPVTFYFSASASYSEASSAPYSEVYSAPYTEALPALYSEASSAPYSEVYSASYSEASSSSYSEVSSASCSEALPALYSEAYSASCSEASSVYFLALYGRPRLTEDKCMGKNYTLVYFNLHSAVSMATGYELNDGGVAVRVPLEVRFSSSPRRPDRFWGPAASYPMDVGDSFPKGKAAGS